MTDVTQRVQQYVRLIRQLDHPILELAHPRGVHARSPGPSVVTRIPPPSHPEPILFGLEPIEDLDYRTHAEMIVFVVRLRLTRLVVGGETERRAGAYALGMSVEQREDARRRARSRLARVVDGELLLVVLRRRPPRVHPQEARQRRLRRAPLAGEMQWQPSVRILALRRLGAVEDEGFDHGVDRALRARVVQRRASVVVLRQRTARVGPQEHTHGIDARALEARVVERQSPVVVLPRRRPRIRAYYRVERRVGGRVEARAVQREPPVLVCAGRALGEGRHERRDDGGGGTEHARLVYGEETQVAVETLRDYPRASLGGEEAHAREHPVPVLL